MASSVINLTFGGMSLLCILGINATPLLVTLIAPGFSGEARSLTIQLTRIMFPCIIFMALSLLMGGILNSLKSFAIPALTAAAFSALVIVSVYLLVPSWGIYGLAAGTLLGCMGQFLIQLPTFKHLKIGYQFKTKLSQPVRAVGSLMLPAMIGTSVNQIYITIDRILASGLVEGSISALNFANRLMMLPFNLFVSSISTAIFPTLSEQAAEKDYTEMARTVVFGLNLIAFFSIPAAVGLFVLSEPVVRVLFEHGAFDIRSTQMTVYALDFYVIGLFAQCSLAAMNRAFFALQDPKTPVAISLFTVFLNLILSLILIRSLAHGGLALANSLAALCNMVLVYWYLRRRLTAMPEKQLFSTLAKILLASLIMGVIVYLANMWVVSILTLDSLKNQILQVGIDIIVGIISFGLLVLPLKISEVDYVLEKLRHLVFKHS
jgi:putative peptidoglycan lipid II flippase